MFLLCYIFDAEFLAVTVCRRCHFHVLVCLIKSVLINIYLVASHNIFTESDASNKLQILLVPHSEVQVRVCGQVREHAVRHAPASNRHLVDPNSQDSVQTAHP